MKRKIVIALSVFSLLFLLGGIYIAVTIEQATSEVDNLLRLHRIEILQEHLLIELKKAQSDLYLKNTRHAQSIDIVVDHVQTMNSALSGCFSCHHSESVVMRLNDLKNHVEQYKSALGRVFTLRASKDRLEAEEDIAYRTGMELIFQADNLTTMTNRRLNERTQVALRDIAHTKKLLYLILVVVPLAVLSLAVLFFRGFTKPVDVLVTATQQLKAGELNYRIEGLKDEYGEVAAAFNEMASSLKEHYFRMQWAEQIVVLGELSGGLAHEMMNPIGGIKGAAQVLSTNPAISEEHRDILLKMVGQVERIESLLRSLLNFAQPPKPSFLLINVNEIFEKTISLAEQHSLFLSKKSRGLAIVRNFDSHLPKILADPIQLQQVFMNLLLNAADAMPNGGTLTVQTSHEEASLFLQVAIRDTGSGIDQNITDKIFQPFFTTKSKGTGLGLSITKRLVEQHGGSIRAANNPSGGASFTIDLPVTPDKVSAA